MVTTLVTTGDVSKDSYSSLSTSQSPSRYCVLFLNGVHHIIIEITILSRSFVFFNSCVLVSIGLSNVGGLVVTACDLIYYSLSVLEVVFVFYIY